MADETRTSAAWKLKFSGEPGTTRMMVAVEGAPASAGAAELAEVLALGATALQREESTPARFDWNPRWTLAAAVLIALVALGVNVWPPAQMRAPLTRALPWLTDGAPSGAPIAYPLPAKAFNDQATAPCASRLGEVEINGACWLELAKQVPCFMESQAEYKGKCYIPVSKLRPARPPTSVEP